MPTKFRDKYRASVRDDMGKRHRPYFEDYDTALAWEETAVAAIEAGKALPSPVNFVPPVKSLTLGEAVDTYFDHVWGEAKDKKGPRNTLRVFMQYLGGQKKLAELSNADLLSYFTYLRNERNAGGNTSNHHLSHVGSLLKTAQRFGQLIPADLANLSQFRRRVGPGRTRYFSETEEQDILSTLQRLGYADFRDFVEFMIYTGARTSEAVNLTWGDISLENKRVRFTATKNARGQYKERSVDLTDSQGKMIYMLTRRHQTANPASTDLVFPTLSYARRRNAWDHMRSELGYSDDPEFIPHTCRHTFASRLASRGVDLYAIQRLMGHQSILMTQRYSHLCPTVTASAVSVL